MLKIKGGMILKMIDEPDNVAHYSKLEHFANILSDKRLRLGPVSELADARESSLTWLEP
jgi:hypothetical protein